MISFYKTPDDRGFTVIEVIAVLIIIGILTAVAISRTGSTQSDLPVQTDIVKSHLRFANLKALQDDTVVDRALGWGISFGGGAYTLLYNNAPAAIKLPGEDSGSHTFPAGVTVTNPTNVIFDAWGSPGPANITITLSQDGTTTSITIAGNTGYVTP